MLGERPLCPRRVFCIFVGVSAEATNEPGNRNTQSSGLLGSFRSEMRSGGSLFAFEHLLYSRYHIDPAMLCLWRVLSLAAQDFGFRREGEREMVGKSGDCSFD